MSLPLWWQLVKACVDDQQLKLDITISEETPTDKLMRVMSRVEKACGSKKNYRNLVRTHLYENALSDKYLLEQKLLVVLGAMTMNSRRGSVAEVITFNFDDILERYLYLHGFTNQVIVDLPSLRLDTDVTVYHPHGYLSSNKGSGKDSKELIFSKYSLDKRMGDRLNPWQELVRDLLLRKFALFVGLSYNNATLSAVLADINDSVKGSRGVTGYWLVLCPCNKVC